MGIPIPVSGMQVFIKEIPDGMLLCLEGGVDLVPSVFAQFIAKSALDLKRKVIYITSQRGDDVLLQMLNMDIDANGIDILENITPSDWLNQYVENGVLIVDSFSYYMIGLDTQEIKKTTEELRKHSRKMNSLTIIISQRGMMAPIDSMVVDHLSDGIIQFTALEKPEGISRYMRVPKWMNGISIDAHLFYTFENNKMNIDTRSRVV